MIRSFPAASAALLALLVRPPILPAQALPDTSLGRASAVLHSPPLVLSAAPVVAVRILSCRWTCPDSMVEIDQAVDSTTIVTVRQWWIGPATRRSGWLERCRHDLRNPQRALDVNACPEPFPQEIEHGLWVELVGPLPNRTLAKLLDRLELTAPLNAGL
jgi:hypothetical protein